MVALDIRVRIPFAAAAAAVKELDEADAALNQTPRDQALLAEGPRFRFVNSVERPGGGRFFVELQSFGNRSLHLKRQFVGLDASAQVLVVRIIDARKMVQLAEQTEIAGLFFWCD